MPFAAVTRRLRAVAVLLLVSVAAAAAVGLLAWHFLPYDALKRESAVEQFLFWEATMWMSALALVLFGLAAWFGATDLHVGHGSVYMNRSSEHVRLQVQQGVSGRTLFSDLPMAPWLMMGTGIGLGLQAAIMRSVVFGGS